MRLNDLSDGSIKTLLILGLLVANLAIALPTKSGHSQPPARARASRAVLGALAENSSGSRASSQKALGEAPSAARKARALPGNPPR